MQRRREETRWEAAFAASPVEDIPSVVASELYGNEAPLGRLLREWSVGDHGFVSLSARPEEHRVPCSVTLKLGQDLLRFSRNLEVSWTRVGHASRRAWIHCSMSGCDRKVRRLFIVPNNLACRQCAGLRYESKNRSAHERSRVRADKLRARLGAERGFGAPFPAEKPKGMHWSTFYRLCDELREEECLFEKLYGDVVDRKLAAPEPRQETLGTQRGATMRLSGSSSVAGPSADVPSFDEPAAVDESLDDPSLDLSEEPDLADEPNVQILVAEMLDLIVRLRNEMTGQRGI